MMVQILLAMSVVFCTSGVSGLKYGFRVKFGSSNELENKEYFYKMPKTISEAEADEWKRTERPDGLLPELRMYCPQGREVCLLYDKAGFVAGLQIALPVNEFESQVIQPEKLVKWSAPAADGEPAREYWTFTQFYVSEESLQEGSGASRPKVENSGILQDGGVWLTGPDRKLLKVPVSEADLSTTAFVKQNCIPNMGMHYHYNMTQQMKCEDLQPWFLLTDHGELIGTGFIMFGKLAPQTPRHWFETPLPKGHVAKKLMPFAPPCVGEWGTANGIITLHIYYVDDPWDIKCDCLRELC